MVGADMFTFPTKQLHVAKLVNLPTLPPPRHTLAPGLHYPTLLIMQIMLPAYSVRDGGGDLAVWLVLGS